MNKLINSTLYGGLSGGVFGLGLGTLIEINAFVGFGKFDKKTPFYISSNGFIIGSHVGVFLFNPFIGIGVSSCSLIGVYIYDRNKY